jgi:hypothetical protein
MRRIVAVGIAGLALLGSGSISRPDASSAPIRLDTTNPRAPLLGVVWKRGGGHLVRVNARTLLPLPGRRVQISENWPVWSFSPDRSKLVIKDDRVVGVSLRPWLRVLDTRTLRTVKWLPLESKVVSHLAWLAPRRVVAIEPANESFDVVLIDTVAQRIVARRTVPGWVHFNSFARAQRSFALLVSEVNKIAPARLVVGDAGGAIKSVALEKILAGTSYPEHDESWSSNTDPSRFIGRRRWPGR